MWSLPDINRLNADAELFKATLEHIVSTGEDENGEPLHCEWESHDNTCEGTVAATPYYDIFSDTPKGHVDLCEKHYGYYGNPSEGFFECEGCNWVFVENYTWELYYHDDECGRLCLNCYREEVLADEDEWLDLSEPANIAAVDFDRIRQAKHLIAVGQDVPESLKFIGNAEFDSFDGHQISGKRIQALLTQARDDGAKRAILILDAAYQFSVSIGTYVDADR